MQNFISEAVLGKYFGNTSATVFDTYSNEETFLTYLQGILEENPIIKFILFAGAVAFAGFYILIFVREIRQI